MTFIIYNDTLKEYSNLFYSILNIMNIYDILITHIQDKKIIQNLLISPNYFIYNFVIYSSIFFIFFITVATFIYMFREATALEIINEDNHILNKLGDISEGLEKLSIKKRENSFSSPIVIRQIIWLCFSPIPDVYNERVYNSGKFINTGKDFKTDDNKFLLFNSSWQIISFFKYLFAIKPKLQFKNLENKFAILIECKNDIDEKNKISQSDLEQIFTLFDWLNFAGCKIPIGIYTDFNLEKNVRMNMKNNFGDLRFITDKFDLDLFLKIFKDDNSLLKNSPKKMSNYNSSEALRRENTEKKDGKILLKDLKGNDLEEKGSESLIFSSEDESSKTKEI